MILDIDFAKIQERSKLSNEKCEVLNKIDDENLLKSCEESSNEVINSTPIQQFYKDQIIFITGGTGFLGKVMIEKLLRCCSNIKRIYVLVRQKKGKKIQERIQDLLNDSVFDRIRPQSAKLQEKIIGVAGDCSLDNLGLGEDDINLLKKEVTIVFHVAATVRFDEKLKTAAATNLQSTQSILNLCKSMKNLKSFIHTSTAYTNCYTSDIDEKFYDYTLKYKELLHLVNSLPEETINDITPQLIKPWPNTYTFTKAMAEDLVRAESQNLPMGIFRPGIVISSAYEPTPGWTDNYNGPTGITAGIASGVVRTMQVDTTRMTNLVPVDLTCNALIASAWDVTNQTNRRGEDMMIYNFTSTSEAPLTWNMFKEGTENCMRQYPSEIALWCTFLQTTKYTFLYNFYAFLLHSVPGLLIDLAARINGRQPTLQKAYQRIDKMTTVMRHFTMNEWRFRNDNVQGMWSRLDNQDQQIFQFTMQNFDWAEYFANYIKGIRVFLLKDDLKTLESSRIKCNRFSLIQQLVVSSFYGLACWMMWLVLHTMLFV